jgi:hypothetical protein
VYKYSFLIINSGKNINTARTRTIKRYRVIICFV